MKRRFIIKVLIFSLILSLAAPVFAEDTTPLPYQKNEFPQGLEDLRRFEIISLGAMPFVTLQTSLTYSTIRWGRHNFDSEYSPNIFATSTYTPEEQREIILTSLGISVGIALTDYVIQLIKRGNARKKQQINEDSLFITPLNLDPDASALPLPEVIEESSQDLQEIQEVND